MSFRINENRDYHNSNTRGMMLAGAGESAVTRVNAVYNVHNVYVCVEKNDFENFESQRCDCVK